MDESDYYQQLQDHDQEFQDWFYGNEVRGDTEVACIILAKKIARVISIEVIRDAYNYKEPEQTENKSSLEDDLIF